MMSQTGPLFTKLPVAILSSHLPQKHKAVAVALHYLFNIFSACLNPFFSTSIEKPLKTDRILRINICIFKFLGQILDVPLVRLVFIQQQTLLLTGVI